MKRRSVMIALRNISCMLLLFSGPTMALAVSRDDRDAASDEQLKKDPGAKESKKRPKERLPEATHHSDRQLANHRNELAGPHQDERHGHDNFPDRRKRD